MVPAARALLWALLLSLGSRAAAGAQGLTSTGATETTGTQPVSFRSGSPMTRNYRSTARTPVSPKRRVTMEDEDDVVATADRLAGPAAAELLASTVSTDVNGSRSWEHEDGSLEEGVVINADKNSARSEAPRPVSSPVPRSIPSTVPSTAAGPSSRFPANIQEPEYRLTTSLPHSSWRSTEDSDTSLTQWTTAGATPRHSPRRLATAMPPPEDLRVMLMPWGPWHCHCKSGTMSRTRAGKLQGLSGRLRVGALSQLRTEHRPCTYRQCPCDRHREECPLDSSICSDASCTTQPTTTSTTSTFPPLSSRLRPTPLHFPSPSPALAFWRRVRIGLEDIWNSLSTVFTEMEPIDRNQR
ncbi:PREDICTED: protein MENT [Hipposideros armiger]|uniref:Protein MENT n=1 Tax=Hipposideros armiger TaxID=186990 RepID=A0A8B7PWI8_HIPAR|nr:PREDICTED: protein MENT [Hipposideros armiger]